MLAENPGQLRDAFGIFVGAVAGGDDFFGARLVKVGTPVRHDAVGTVRRIALAAVADDGMVGQQVFAGEATRLAYMTDEAKEGRDAFLEKRKPNFEKKWIP